MCDKFPRKNIEERSEVCWQNWQFSDKFSTPNIIFRLREHLYNIISFSYINNRPSLRLSRHNRESSMAGLVYKASSSLVWPRYYWNQSNDNQEEEWNLPRRFASLIISNIDTCVARISSSCVLWGNNEESVWISEQQVCYVTNKYIYIKEYFYHIYVLLLLYYFYVVLHTCYVLN